MATAAQQKASWGSFSVGNPRFAHLSAEELQRWNMIESQFGGSEALTQFTQEQQLAVSGFGSGATAGKGITELGFTESGLLPRNEIAQNLQNQANQAAAQRNARLGQEALQTLRSGLGNLSSYRPGGAAAMASPFYGQMANTLLSSRAEAPDLLHDYRRNEQFQQRRRDRQAANLQLGASIATAGIHAIGMGLAGGAAPAPGIAGAPPGSGPTGGIGPLAPGQVAGAAPTPGQAGLQGPPTFASASQATGGGSQMQASGGPPTGADSVAGGGVLAGAPGTAAAAMEGKATPEMNGDIARRANAFTMGGSTMMPAEQSYTARNRYMRRILDAAGATGGAGMGGGGDTGAAAFTEEGFAGGIGARMGMATQDVVAHLTMADPEPLQSFTRQIDNQNARLDELLAADSINNRSQPPTQGPQIPGSQPLPTLKGMSAAQSPGFQKYIGGR